MKLFNTSALYTIYNVSQLASDSDSLVQHEVEDLILFEGLDWNLTWLKEPKVYQTWLKEPKVYRNMIKRTKGLSKHD